MATLTAAQLTAIKNDIAANSDLNVNPNNDNGNQVIADLYNLIFSPAFIVWKSSTSITSVGAAIDKTELAARTTADSTNLQTLAQYSPGGVNPSDAGMRNFYDNIFSSAGGANTRANLAVLWKRSARRIEKILASGTGTTASPATLGFEGTVQGPDITAARNS